MNALMGMASASMNNCFAYRRVNVDNVNWTALSCCGDANRSTGSVDCKLGMNAGSSVVVIIGEMPHSALVLIEGCAV